MLEKIFSSDPSIIEKYNIPFKIFSVSHISTLLLSLLAWVLLIVLLKKSSAKVKKYFRIILAASLIFIDFSWYMWAFFGGKGLTLAESFPLQLCSFALWVSIILLFTKKKFFFELAYFWGIGGAAQAFLTPSITFGFPNYRFFHFFSFHFCLVLVPLYFIFIEKYKVTWKSLLKTSFATIFIMFFVMFMNYIIGNGANYMFVSRKPEFPSIIDLFVKIFGPWPFYLIGNFLLGLFVFIILYLPFMIIEIKDRVKRSR